MQPYIMTQFSEVSYFDLVQPYISTKSSIYAENYYRDLPHDSIANHCLVQLHVLLMN